MCSKCPVSRALSALGGPYCRERSQAWIDNLQGDPAFLCGAHTGTKESPLLMRKAFPASEWVPIYPYGSASGHPLPGGHTTESLHDTERPETLSGMLI